MGKIDFNKMDFSFVNLELFHQFFSDNNSVNEFVFIMWARIIRALEAWQRNVGYTVVLVRCLGIPGVWGTLSLTDTGWGTPDTCLIGLRTDYS